MIQIYKPGNTAFDRNGDMVLMPESATVHAVLNGDWDVKMIHPVDEDGRWKYIEDESVVKMPSFNGDQLFRIKSKVKTESRIEITAVIGEYKNMVLKPGENTIFISPGFTVSVTPKWRILDDSNI